MVDRGRIAIASGIAVTLVAANAAVWWLSERRVADLVLSENGAVQVASSVAFLTGAVLFAAGYRYTHRSLYLLLAVAFFFAAGEEAGWGQHAAGFQGPEVIAENNAQDRMTAHNLDIVQDLKRAAGIDLMFAGFLLLVFAYLVLVPALARRSADFGRVAGRYLPIEPLTYGTLLLANSALYSISAVVGTNAVGRDAPTEVAELGCAVIMAGVGLDAVRRGRAQAHAADRARASGLGDSGGALAV